MIQTPQNSADAPEQGEPAPNSTDPYYDKPVWKRLYAFILGPLLLAAGAVALFTIVSLLTAENITPAQLVEDLRTAGNHRRWQAAFELTRYLQPKVASDASGAKVEREPDEDYQEKLEQVRIFLPELIEIFEKETTTDDPQVRRYLALALGYLGDKRVVPSLNKVLEEEDQELVIYALGSLATLGNADAIPAVIQASKREEAQIRSVAVYVLGVLGTQPATDRLLETLGDLDPSVKWNSAFGLARLGRSEGAKVISEILDRGPLYETAGLSQPKQREQFLNAVRSAGMLRTPELEERLTRIARTDNNLQARDLAMKLLEDPPQ